MSTIPRPATYGLDASFPRFSVARYLRMVETGILDDADRVELLEGYLVRKMSRNPPHDSALLRLQRAIYRILPAGWDIRSQSAILFTDSVPEPDVALVRADPADYANRHPFASEVGLVIEVAESSLPRDLQDKARIYARASIPVYWVIDLVNHRVVVLTAPSGPGDEPTYGQRRDALPGEVVPLVLDGGPVADVPVADLLPRGTP